MSDLHAEESQARWHPMHGFGDLIATLQELTTVKVGFVSLSEALDF